MNSAQDNQKSQIQYSNAQHNEFINGTQQTGVPKPEGGGGAGGTYILPDNLTVSPQ